MNSADKGDSNIETSESEMQARIKLKSVATRPKSYEK